MRLKCIFGLHEWENFSLKDCTQIENFRRIKMKCMHCKKNKVILINMRTGKGCFISNDQDLILIQQEKRG